MGLRFKIDNLVVETGRYRDRGEVRVVHLGRGTLTSPVYLSLIIFHGLGEGI